MREELRVATEKLRRVFNPADFNFDDTSTVPPAKGFIGQERAEQAIKMGLEIGSPEYNVFITGITGISRKSVLLDYLNRFAEEKAAAGGFSLRDFCYVYNFEKPNEPQVLIFKRGDGRKFAKRLEAVLSGLQKNIPAILKSERYLKARDDMVQDTEQKSKELFSRLEKRAKEVNLTILHVPPSGYAVRSLSRRPGDEGSLMGNEEHAILSQEEKERIDSNISILESGMQKVFQKIFGLRKETQQKIEDLERGLIKDFLKGVFGRLARRYSDYRELLDFFRGLQDYVLDNINLFREDGATRQNGQNGHNGDDPFLPFKVNLFVDNSRTEKIPVIFESNPSFHNLFGSIGKRFMQGGYLTDHTYLKAGSLIAAEGGYLVLNILDVLRNPGVWERLEKTIRYGYLKIEEPMSYLGLVPESSNPQPIPVQVRVILVGNPTIYQLLVQHDPEFSAIFKIKAELDSEMPSTPANQMAYAGFVALCCAEEDLRRERRLLPFDASAVAKIIEYGYRLADSQAKLSTKFHQIKDLIVESDYWAGKEGSGAVKADHVKKAIELRRLRANLLEEKFQEFIKEGTLLIAVDGDAVGQINGLVVYNVGDYSFGLPHRITAKTFLGNKGVVSIDKDVKMSGPIHDKGVHIFLGYFGGKYAAEKPISFSASICFEQSYGMTEGDSASVAELVCLISSVAGLPVKQYLAITGSVNQKGEIQPIGGVNEKIEGFFNVCQERGLTGSQGVVIPHQNVGNLMLNEDVVDACQKGKFHVFAVETVDQALELLLGEEAGVIHQKVSECLSEMTKKIKKVFQEVPNEG